MEVECLKLESWLKAKEELKLSKAEIEYLKQKGIVLTTMDIACIKRTEGTELVFLSKDKKAIHKINSVFVFIVDNISYSNWGTNNTASAGTVPMAFSLEISTYPCSEGSK